MTLPELLRVLNRRLRSSIRFDDSVGRGYLLADIESAFRRYVPNPEVHSVPKPEPPQISDVKS